jgi:hypothetical protein
VKHLKALKVNEIEGWIGEYEIVIRHKDGTEIREKLKNRLTNAGLNMVRDALNGDLTDIKLKYLALGDSKIAIDDTQTQLGNERFRTPFIKYDKPATGQLKTTAIAKDNEAVFQIEEIGIFAGSTATSAANTGILVSRILYSRNKTNLESIQFIRTDTFNRG